VLTPSLQIDILFISSFLPCSPRRTLFSGVQKHLAPDAVLEVPIHEAQGPQSIHDVVALHAAFTTDSAVGDVKWDEE
jgi:hypothetical protein